jgi:diketogulonate reductase-like aldo/keto reductase
VQRGNTVIPKSSTESRIKSNFELFELEKHDFDAVEGIAGNVGQKRFGNLDSMWGSSLFAEETF